MGEPQAADEGGEAPCYAHLVDPETGEITDDGPAGEGDQPAGRS
ncbi:MAG TPA: hypothetical protein VFZ79_09695 [Acidimicrobiales bacterium]